MAPVCGTRTIARRLRLNLVLALCFVAAALMPLAHHDAACHLKSTTHCTTCNVGSSAEPSGDAATMSCVVLNDAGDAAAEPSAKTDSLSVLAEFGRAPPSFA